MLSVGKLIRNFQIYLSSQNNIAIADRNQSSPDTEVWLIRAESEHYLEPSCSKIIKTNLKLPVTIAKDYYFAVSDSFAASSFRGLSVKIGLIKPSEEEKIFSISVLNNTNSLIKINKSQILAELFRRKFDYK